MYVGVSSAAQDSPISAQVALLRCFSPRRAPLTIEKRQSGGRLDSGLDKALHFLPLFLPLFVAPTMPITDRLQQDDWGDERSQSEFVDYSHRISPLGRFAQRTRN